MTRVQLRYHLLKPVDEALMKSINNAHAIYGIEQIKLQPSLEEILVEYDASRLSIDKVENSLKRAGIPATRILPTPPAPPAPPAAPPA
jgi:copper chaperone CopZ